MRPKSVLIQLEPEAFRRLAAVARDEVRSVDQQAAYFVRRALGEAPPAQCEEVKHAVSA